MSSIRAFLIIGIVATLTLFNFVAALRGYQSSMKEADTLFDNQLLDLSQLVANLDLGDIQNDFRLGNNLAFQIWQGEDLLASSYHAPDSRVTAKISGFDFANFNGYRWRTFTRLDEQRTRSIIVAERSDLRFVLAENVVLESLAPILLGIPVVALLIWVVVGRGLKPLHELSADLRKKKASDLQPLNYERSPAELNQVVQSVNSFIHRLNEALEREKRFSADAAHELRTPISALKLQLHNLSQEVDTSSEAWQELQLGVERMQHLVEQLLSLYRSSPEQFARECSVLDLHAITQEVVARFYPVIEQHKQVLELEAERCYITGERFALETLLTNLLSNASKYTPEGGNIRVSIKAEAGRVCVSVEDDGPGIPEDARQHIFDRFYRFNSANVTGCGLGLTIVQHVASLHQASVTVEDSGFASGTAFKVCFREAQA